MTSCQNINSVADPSYEKPLNVATALKCDGEFPAERIVRHSVVLSDAKLGNLYGGVLGLPLQFLVGADGKILAI